MGRRFRALRRRLGWRQQDLADRAGVSQDLISRIERGRVQSIALGKLRSVAAQLDAEYATQLRWRAGDLDRLVDEAHASLVGELAAQLGRLGWTVRPEVSYSIYGERGSVDLLAWHPRGTMLLVVEVKSALVSVEETIRKLDEKARLGPRIAGQAAFVPTFGDTVPVARLLVLPSTDTARRRVARHAAVLGAAFPVRGSDLRQWLAEPNATVSGNTVSGLLFLGLRHVGGRDAQRGRVRVRSTDGDRSTAKA